MAEGPKPTGMVLMYGAAIGYALMKGDVPTKELIELKQQAEGLVSDHGNLHEALAALEDEISRRKDAPPAAKSGPAPSAEKFVIDLPEIGLSADQRNAMQARLRDAVLSELAKIDTGGDLTATALSELKYWSQGDGGTTAGMIVHRPIPNPI